MFNKSPFFRLEVFVLVALTNCRHRGLVVLQDHEDHDMAHVGPAARLLGGAAADDSCLSGFAQTALAIG